MKIAILDDQGNHQFYQNSLQSLGDIDIFTKFPQLIQKGPYQLIIVEVFLEADSGFELMPKLKKYFPKAIIIYTSEKTFEENIIHGLEIGATDYLERPLSEALFLAKVRSRLPKIEQVIQLGNLTFYPTKNIATIKDQRITLSPKEAKILTLLCSNPNELLKRDELIESVWPGTKVGNQNLDTHVSNLRKKLALANIKIKSVKYAGYIMET
ncbi:MAG: response regulator transcription factor [Bacteriovoracaceae bacterium]